jgi:hypothetical protein
MANKADKMHPAHDVPAFVVAVFVLLMGSGGLILLTTFAQTLTAVL